MRLRIDLSYEGTDFHGWAAQPGLRTVQGLLSEALALVLRTDAVALTCAGRTDAGVHARGQVAHLDVDAEVFAGVVGRVVVPAETALLRRLNGVLPPDVRVQAVTPAPAGFDARFAAVWRRYVYRIADDPAFHDPLRRREVVAWPHALELDALNAASALLVGEHDFAAFCKPREGATTIRHLLEFEWTRQGGLLCAVVRADAFCHSMVRALVGCVVTVGEGRRPAEWAASVLAAEVRDPAVRVMPAQGLTLEEVAYPADADLAARAEETRVLRTRDAGPQSTPEHCCD